MARMGEYARDDNYQTFAPSPEELDRLIDPPMPRAPVMPSPWDIGVLRANTSLRGQATQRPDLAPPMGSILALGRAAPTIEDVYRGIPGQAAEGFRHGMEVLSVPNDPELDLLGQQRADGPDMNALGQEGMASAAQQIREGTYQPQTNEGKMAGAVTRMVSNPVNWVGPASMLAKTVGNVAAGVGGETGRRMYEGTPYEKVAETVGSFVPVGLEQLWGFTGKAVHRLPEGQLGSGGGRMTIPTRRQTEVSAAASGEDFPWATGLDRPQGNWMVRHTEAGPEMSVPKGSRGTGFSGLAASKPVEEMTATVRGAPRFERNVMDIADLQKANAELLMGVSDRTRAGGRLVEAGGYKFDRPIKQEGGVDYPLLQAGKAVSDPDTMRLFANAPTVATKINQEALDILERGRNPYFAAINMNKMAGDSSRQIADTVYQAARQAEPNKALVKAIDDSVASELNLLVGKPKEPYPGFASKELKQWLDTTAGPYRAAFVKALDRANFMKQGMPDVGEMRFANTDPRLVNTPIGSGGLLVGKMRPDLGTVPSLHSNYPSAFLGERSDVGQLAGSVPFHLLAPDIHRGLVAAGKAKGKGEFENVPAYYMMNSPPKGVSRSQPVTQEVVDNVSRFLAKYPQGWAVGAVPFMGALAAHDRYDQ